ncbi:hypothetical protein AB1N83_012752 [Pleurotus pulmonarius]
MQATPTKARQFAFFPFREYWPALDVCLKKFGKDTTAKVAQYCARTTASILEESPSHSKIRSFSTPRVKLYVFIDRLLRRTNVPLPHALATLAVMRWMTQGGLCPLTSSSPHHLFLAALRIVSHFASPDKVSDVDAQWVRYSGGVIHLNEVFLMRMELAELLPMAGERHWALLSSLSSVNSAVTVIESSNGECSQVYESEGQGETTEPRVLATSQQDLDFDNTHYDFHRLGGWHIDPGSSTHRRKDLGLRVRRIASRITGCTR